MDAIERIVRQPSERRHDTPLLFLHGAWHGAWCWQSWLETFADLGYEAHAISLPGHGGSPARRHINRYTLGSYAAVLASAVAAIRPTPAVVARSMGGAILRKYLEEHPLPAAVFVAPTPVGGIGPMLLRFLRRHPVATLRGLLSFDSYHLVATPELARSHFFSAGATVDVAAVHAQLVRESSTANAQAVLPYLRRLRRDTPALVLAGERDVVFSVAEERRTAARFHARFVTFAGQAHNLMLEPAGREVAQTIDEWLRAEVGLP
jgi:pimeloyl-ACP methyl ester carboxylesterase